MTDRAATDLEGLADDLDGHTIDELADYLDRGRTPMDPTIEVSSSCRHALAALERLRDLTDSLLTGDGASAETDESWIESVMSRIAIDARAGADFTIARTSAGDEVVMTEGALRGLIRAAGDGLPGVLVGRIRFAGQLDAPGSDVIIALDVVVMHGTAIPATVRRLRSTIHQRLQDHTMLIEPRLDITVRDLIAGSRA